MTATLSWPEIILRLGLTVLAGMLIGLDRDQHAHPTGLRTTVLIAVAASVVMVLANWLLAATADMHNPMVRLSAMRLPEGVLSGVGFIGAGAILRRGEIVRGITSAATIWLVTIIGLCFGSGQLGLGGIATAIARATLWLMKYAEQGLLLGRRGRLSVTFVDAGPHEALMLGVLRDHRFELRAREVERVHGGATRITCTGRYRGRFPDWSSALLQDLAARPEISQVKWSDID